jgi:rhomboid protease GluP
MIVPGEIMESAHAGDTSFAVYLTKFFIVEKGFVAAVVPEAAALAATGDIVLSRGDGMTFEMICIVDGETQPDRRFETSLHALRRIGEQCLKYCGTMNGAKMPVTFRIFEIGPGLDSPETRRRLRGFCRESLFSKVIPSAWLIDTQACSIWTSAAMRGIFAGRREIERLLQEPRRALVPRSTLTSTTRRSGHPWLTYALLATLIAVFVCELAFGLDPPSGLLQPSVRTLAAMGGSNWNLVVGGGEWYRIASAPFLHAGLVHLLLNGFVLLLAGTATEMLFGRAWFAAIYTISAVAGVIVSLSVNPVAVVSVGASGALMGILAAVLVSTIRLQPGVMRSQLQRMTLQVLIPSLLPLAMGTGQHVDYGAHIGGALGGAFMGLIVLGLWPSSEPSPRLRWLASAVAVAGLLATCAALGAGANTLVKFRHENDLRAMLIANNQLPRTDAEMKSQAESLFAHYPRDPRVRLVRGMALLDAGNSTGAERELRAGLAEEEILKSLLPPRIDALLRTNLAIALYGNRQTSEAKAIARPVCELTTAENRPMREPLKRIGICE